MRRLLLLALPVSVLAQQPQGAAAPTNNLPDPYRAVEGWARLPAGRTWGSLSAVAVDRDGVSIWVAERCGSNSCLNSTLAPVMKFDSTGALVTSFGAGLLLSPHGIDVDRNGNVWVTDCACTGASVQAHDSTRGHQVLKFSPSGKLLLALGRAGGAREPGYFWQPNDVLVAPNGDIYVAEGHSDDSTANARILKFDSTGKLLRSWGVRGTGTAPGQLMQPHALAMDSRGRLFVGDRSNNRILILDQDFNQLGVWTQFSRPSGIYIDASDNMYVADSESGSVAPEHGAWARGIRVGSARDGSVSAFIPDTTSNATGTSFAEGVAADRNGNIYAAMVGQHTLKRYARAQR
jgi:DNA-binding beta-propeller fold protein YncE